GAGGVVQNEEPGVVHEGQHEAQLLLVASRVLAEPATEVEVEPLGKRCNSRAVDAGSQAGYVADHLAAAEAAELRQLSGQVADETLDLDRPRLAVHTEDLGPAARRPDHVHQQPDRRRLAGAVRAKVAEDLAGGHVEVEVEQPPTVAVVLAQVLRQEGCFHSCLLRAPTRSIVFTTIAQRTRRLRTMVPGRCSSSTSQAAFSALAFTLAVARQLRVSTEHQGAPEDFL